MDANQNAAPLNANTVTAEIPDPAGGEPATVTAPNALASVYDDLENLYRIVVPALLAQMDALAGKPGTYRRVDRNRTMITRADEAYGTIQVIAKHTPGWMRNDGRETYQVTDIKVTAGSYGNKYSATFPVKIDGTWNAEKAATAIAKKAAAQKVADAKRNNVNLERAQTVSDAVEVLRSAGYAAQAHADSSGLWIAGGRSLTAGPGTVGTSASFAVAPEDAAFLLDRLAEIETALNDRKAARLAKKNA